MNRPLRVIALDLSLAATGIAVTHDQLGEPRLACRTVSPRKRPHDTVIDHERLNETFQAIAAACNCRPDLVVIEWLPKVHGTGGTPLRVAELHGAIKQWLYARRLRYVDVNPSHLKQYATGKGGGRTIDKAAVRADVIARYGALLHIHTSDEADAVALLAMALDAYGQPLAEVPATNRRAIAGVTWPELDLGAGVR